MSSAIRLPVFGDLTDEQYGLRIVRAPEDRVRLYAARIERIIAVVGQKAVAWDMIDASIFDEPPPVIRTRPARHDYAPAMIEHEPCQACGGIDWRRYTGRMDAHGRRRVDLRCVACSRARTRRSWLRRKEREAGARG